MAILLFCISMFGFLHVSVKTLKINVFASGIFVCSSIALLVFAGGLANVLWQTALTIYVIGLLLGLVGMVDVFQQRTKLYPRIKIVYIGYLVLGAVLLYILWHAQFIHYDNFSHWASIVKYMLANNHIPNAQSVFIEFVDYPLGASSFIYYVARFIGEHAGAMLVAQGVLILSCFFAIHGIIKEEKRLLLYLVLALGLCMTSFFNLSIRLNNLLVDFLLPMMGLAAIASLYQYRKRPFFGLFVTLPVLAVLVVVKNTGIFFASLALVYGVYIFITHAKYRTIFHKFGCFLAYVFAMTLSYLPLVAWSGYTSLEFAHLQTKFEVSSENIGHVVAGKTAADLQQIIRVFAQATFTSSNMVTLAFVVINILAILLFFVARYGLKKRWYLMRVVILSDIVVIVYFLGILVMYLFLMPLDEAIRIAGYERYIASIIVFQLGCVAMCFTCDLERSFHMQIGNQSNSKAFASIHTKALYEKACLICMVLACLVLTSEFNGLQYINLTYEASLPARVNAQLGVSLSQAHNARVLVVASNQDEQVSSYYLSYIVRYELFTPYVDVISSSQGLDLTTFFDSYDYLFIFEPVADVAAYLYPYFGEALSVGLYQIEPQRIVRMKEGETT
ncbi:MAG: hypothetical protein ACRCZJ_02560 [Erysipelotrichaceae bacterium]